MMPGYAMLCCLGAGIVLALSMGNKEYIMLSTIENLYVNYWIPFIIGVLVACLIGGY